MPDFRRPRAGRWTPWRTAPPARLMRHATGTVLVRATRLRLRPEHLSVLDGRTLNVAAVLSEAPPAGPAAVEFASGDRRTRAAARMSLTADGRARIEATVRLRAGETENPSEPAERLPEVVLAAGRWSIRLLLSGDGRTRRLALAAPTDSARSGPYDGARFAVVRTLSGAAAISAAPPRPAANVGSIVLRPHRAQVRGELLNAGAPDTIVAEMALRGGRTVHPIRPLLAPGPHGSGFTVELPLAAMAASSPCIGADLHWELRFRTGTGKILPVRRADVAPHVLRTALPAQTVRPENGPPVLLRPYYADAATLIVVLTALPPGA